MTVLLEPTSERTQCFDIQTIDDTVVEGTEYFIVSLTKPVRVTISFRKRNFIKNIRINDNGDSKSVYIVLIVHE